ALLKQGFAFLNIGDKSSAKLLLEQVAKNYPGTSQARMARAKLAEIK
ncbi:MAG: tetratricopeptide repeat protein, partial [Syntrophales bacterium]